MATEWVGNAGPLEEPSAVWRADERAKLGTWLTASTPAVSFRHRVVGSKPVGVRSRQLISLIKAAICLAPSPATRRFSAIPTLLSTSVALAGP
jgi:hypothetical protein